MQFCKPNRAALTSRCCFRRPDRRNA